MVTLQGLADLGNLFRAEAQLAGLAARVTHIEDSEGITFTAGAFGTTAGVMEGALEERAAQHLAQIGDASHEFVAGIHGASACHHY